MKAVGIGIGTGLKMGVDQTSCLSGRSIEVCTNLIRDIKAGEINSVILVVGGRLYDSKGRSWSDADKMEDYLKESGITCPIFSPIFSSIMDVRNLREGAMDALHTRFFFLSKANEERELFEGILLLSSRVFWKDRECFYKSIKRLFCSFSSPG